MPTKDTRNPSTQAVAEAVDAFEALLWCSRTPAPDRKARLRERYKTLMDALGRNSLKFEDGVPVGDPGIQGWSVRFTEMIGHAVAAAFILRSGQQEAESGLATLLVLIREEVTVNRMREYAEGRDEGGGFDPEKQ